MNFAEYAGTHIIFASRVVTLLVVPVLPLAESCAPRVTTVGVHIGSSYQSWVNEAERAAAEDVVDVMLCVYSASEK